MRTRIMKLLGVVAIAGCRVDAPTCTDCDTSEGLIELTAEQISGGAVLVVEFTQEESLVGTIGWHLMLGYSDAVSLVASSDELLKMLDERGYDDISLDQIGCARWNVTYQNGRWLCEGNDYTPTPAVLIADTDLKWFGEDWGIDTWSDPDSELCYAVACED